MSKEKQILQMYAENHSQRSIASILGVSRNTVSSVVAGLKRTGKTVPELCALEEAKLNEVLFPEKTYEPVQVKPDFEKIHKELLRNGVTLRLLWEEYSDTCREARKPAYKYSHFCQLYSNYVDQNRLTLHIKHKPGDRLMVDWAGTKLHIYDSDTDASRSCYLFVATLPFSMYCYAEAFLSMKQEDWITAHVHAYSFLGGSTRILVSDNLKTGVLKHSRNDDPVFNRSYEELAEHYHTALLPARVLAPKDKAAVEGSVGQLTSRVIAKLRDRKFFSLDALNNAIWQELEIFNERPFQKREGSRLSVFNEEELPYLQPLPAFPYELAVWKVSTVQLNYHIAIDNQYYSVPYAYARKKVDVRLSRNLIEVFYQNNRVCSHRKIYGPKGQYATNPDHMPANHRLYQDWNKERFLNWSETIGPATNTVVMRMFEAHPIEEQAYRGCLSMLKLADRYTGERLEAACEVALRHITNPRYKNIRLILEAGQDRPEKKSSVQENAETVNRYTHLRGPAYYGGGKNE